MKMKPALFCFSFWQAKGTLVKCISGIASLMRLFVMASIEYGNPTEVLHNVCMQYIIFFKNVFTRTYMSMKESESTHGW